MHAACKQYSSCLFYSVNALTRLVSRIADEEFAETGLASSHAMLVIMVNDRPGIQPSELAGMMQLAPSTVTRFVDKMEQQGLVLRTVDGKHSYLLPTQAGKKIDADLRLAQSRLNGRLQEILGAEVIKELTATLWQATQSFALETV